MRCPLTTSNAQPPVGQSSSLVGLDAATGRQRWRAPVAVSVLLAAGADAKADRVVLTASARSPEMKKLLASPPPAKKPAAKKGSTK